MRTFFIYDTAYCKADEDDPKDAVLYFFPTQVFENQCYSLCCQIVGVAKFLRSTFSCPSIITLDKEKFALHWSGKYLFVLGGDADIQGSVLKRQLIFLCGIFCFYHGSINNFLRTCQNNKKEFLAKMELAWSRYITLSQCFSNLLHLPLNAVSLSNMKKYNDNVSKANQLLRMCQLSASVIAGAVYYNSRVLSSQLSPEITSYLTLMSNENAASPVNSVNSLPKSLPPDVELKYIYMNQKIIQTIVKQNHICLGSSVRVKMNERTRKSQLPSYCDNVTSGSEGDDSGNCTESVSSKGRAESNPLNKLGYVEFNFKSQLLCCSMHAEIFKKDLMKCRNKLFKKYVNSEFISEKLKTFEKKAFRHLNGKRRTASVKEKMIADSDNKALSFNLLCHHHAQMFSSSFLSKSSYDHLNLSSTSDLEYSCYFCINHRFSARSNLSSLKRWNSEMQIPDYLHHIPDRPHILEYSSTCDRLMKGKNKCKIQILRCRSRSDACTQCARRLNSHSYHSKRHCAENALNEAKYQTSKRQTTHVSQNMCFTDYWENMESNDLEKSVLYVQRCENNMLLLLLNKNYDDNILTYLWNCGFTFLKDLDYYTDRKLKEFNEADPVNYVMVYDSVHNILKERPNFQRSLFNDKHVKDSAQTIQEDFQSNSKLHMFSLLSANQSIFACQTKHNTGFYLQQDLNSRKSESLCNLSKRGARRFEKYLKTPV